ncbi:MAG: hypothetical protein JSV48_11480, partial [Bradyrhizobium sp.]
TEAGGDLMPIEVALMEGKGNLTLTGQLGDVMQESAQAAQSYARSVLSLHPLGSVSHPLQSTGNDRHASGSGTPLDSSTPAAPEKSKSQTGSGSLDFDKLDIHIHIPEGAIPKDGPSAGITLATALISALTGQPVRRDVAMTGEITLRGRVLPIGGLKEKLLAAARGGIKTVLIPEDNAKDLTEISDAIKGGMEIIPVSRLDDVVAKALVKKPVPIVWEEDTKVTVKPDGDEAAGGLTAH